MSLRRFLDTIICCGLFFMYVTNVCFAGIVPEELRLGVLKHDIGSGLDHRHELGYDVNAELLWESPKFKFFEVIFAPRPHLGVSLNTRGRTDLLYAGLTWRIDFLTKLFIEATFGGAIHNGNINTKTPKIHAMGTRCLFRESLSFGVQLNQVHSLSVIVDHASNGFCERNPGLTALGLRYGFKF